MLQHVRIKGRLQPPVEEHRKSETLSSSWKYYICIDPQ